MAKTKKTMAFTQARIRAIEPPETGRIEIYDEEVPKLVCRVTVSGHKSFVVVGWDNRKQKGIRVTIGDCDDVNVKTARTRAIKILHDIKSGVDVVAQKKAEKISGLTLAGVLDEYTTARILKERTKHEYHVVLSRHFSDWKDKPVQKITEKMVIDRHKELTRKGTTTANSAMRVLRLLMRYAEAIHVIDSIPTDVLSRARMWHKPRRKDRIIPAERLGDWLAAVEALDNVRARVYLLSLLYMGFRANELLHTRWSDVDLRSDTLTLLETKNDKKHTLPIPHTLHREYTTLKAVTGKSKSGFVFDSEIIPGQAMDVPKRTIKSICETTGIEFSSHDCRRTFATISESIGIPLTMIKRLLNHATDNEVTTGYIRTETNTLRDAIERIADAINSLRN